MKNISYILLLLALVPWADAQQRSPEALFKQWDKNKDSKLSLAELPINARRNFARVDTNKDGAISRKAGRQGALAGNCIHTWRRLAKW